MHFTMGISGHLFFTSFDYITTFSNVLSLKLNVYPFLSASKILLKSINFNITDSPNIFACVTFSFLIYIWLSHLTYFRCKSNSSDHISTYTYIMMMLALWTRRHHISCYNVIEKLNLFYQSSIKKGIIFFQNCTRK